MSAGVSAPESRRGEKEPFGGRRGQACGEGSGRGWWVEGWRRAAGGDNRCGGSSTKAFGESRSKRSIAGASLPFLLLLLIIIRVKPTAPDSPKTS